MPKRDKPPHGEPFRGRGNAGAMRMDVSPDDHRYPDMTGPIDIAPSGFVDRGGQKRRSTKAGNRGTGSAVRKNKPDGKRMSKRSSTKKRSRG